MKTLLKGAMIGGVIVYAWGTISWMALPWHARTLHKLDHEVDVLRMLDFGAPVSGIYLSRGTPQALIAFSKEGPRPMRQALALGFLIQVFGALVLTWFFSRMPGAAYGERVFTAAMYGLAVGLLGQTPNWIWWNFAADFTWISVADAVIGWTLAGCALGKVL